jgi:ribonucleoside-diphosphate reductase alpha chain
MTERLRLRNRRPSETLSLEHAGLKYTVTISRFDDRRIAEAFIGNHKRGNASDVAARDAGILLSLLLQYGCPIETIRHAVLRNSNGSASGVVGSVLDLVVADEGGR